MNAFKNDALVLTTQRRSDLSGINSYLEQLELAATDSKWKVKILSVPEVGWHRVWKEIGASRVVHINTSDPISIVLAKLRLRPTVVRFHYTFWGTTLTENFVEIGFLKRLRMEVGGRWKQFGGWRPSRMIHFLQHMNSLARRMFVAFSATRVVGCSTCLTRCLELPRQCFTIYYPFSTPDKVSVGGETGDFLFCGRVDNAKGVLELIEAIGYLKKAGRLVRLRVAGDGVARSLAEAKVAEHEIQDQVVFLGRLTGEAVQREMSLASVLVVPSISNDPSPLVVLEAGAMRMSVIGTIKGGVPEEIGDGGWLIDPTNTAAFAQTLWEVWNNRAECKIRGERLHAHQVLRFDPNRSLEAIMAVALNPEKAIQNGAIPHSGRW